MITSVTIVGSAITLLNIAILIILTVNIIKSYRCAVDVDKSKSTDDLNFYFMQLITSMIFFVANAIALYTGFLTYILKPWYAVDAMVYWRLADRTGMLSVAILMMWNRMKHRPFK